MERDKYQKTKETRLKQKHFNVNRVRFILTVDIKEEKVIFRKPLFKWNNTFYFNKHILKCSRTLYNKGLKLTVEITEKNNRKKQLNRICKFKRWALRRDLKVIFQILICSGCMELTKTLLVSHFYTHTNRKTLTINSDRHFKNTIAQVC